MSAALAAALLLSASGLRAAGLEMAEPAEPLPACWGMAPIELAVISPAEAEPAPEAGSDLEFAALPSLSELRAADLPPENASDTTPAGAGENPLSTGLRKLLRFEKLAPGERLAVDARLESALRDAENSDLPLPQRQEAVVFMARTTLLSMHDLQTKRLGEDRLYQLRFGMSKVQREADDALVTIDRHLHLAVPPEARDFMFDAVLQYLGLK